MTTRHIALACLLGVVSGCGGTGSSTSLPANATANPPPNQPNPPAQGDLSVATILGYLPRDTGIVGRADFRKLRASSHYSEHQALIESQLDHEAVRLFRDECRIDIVTAAGSVTVAVPPTDDDDRTVVVISSTVTWPQLHECVDKLGFEFDQDGEISIYHNGTEPLYLRWISDNTFMMTANPSGHGLHALADQSGSLMDDPVLAALVSQTDTAAMVWLAADTDKARGHMQGISLVGWIGFFGHAELPGDLSGRFGLAFDSDSNATNTEAMVRTQLAEAAKQPMVAPYVGAVSIRKDGTNLLMDLNLPEGDVRTLLSFAKMAMP